MVARFSTPYTVSPVVPVPFQRHNVFTSEHITMYETILTNITLGLNIRIAVMHWRIEPIFNTLAITSYSLRVSSYDNANSSDYEFDNITSLAEHMRQLSLPELTENTVSAAVRADGDTGIDIGYTHSENFAQLFCDYIRE